MQKYTERRGNVFWFKRRAPKPLQSGFLINLDGRFATVGKNGYIKFPLRTSDAREAAKQARKYAHLIDEAASTLPSSGSVIDEGRITRTSRPQPLMVDASELGGDVIQRCAEAMYADLLAADERTYEEGVQMLLDDDAAGLGDDRGMQLDQPPAASDEQAESMQAYMNEVREPDRYDWGLSDLPPATLKGQTELLRMLMHSVNFYLVTEANKVAVRPSKELLPFADAFRRFVDAMEKRRQSDAA